MGTSRIRALGLELEQLDIKVRQEWTLEEGR
jgi:hypothetical protein